MAIRNVKKSLASMEDIAQGVGVVSQTRSGTTVNVHKMDVPFAVLTDAEMSALDVLKYTRARVYTGTISFVDYIYDSTSSEGIVSDTGVGTWRPVTTSATSSSYDFKDLAEMLASPVVFESGKLLVTSVNNTDTNMGGAKYRVVTIAEYAAETPLAPTPDGELIGGRNIGMDHYLNGGTALVAKYNKTVGFDRAAGTIGDDRILGATHDDHPALQKLFDWSKQNSPLDASKIQKGYQKTFIHPRSRFYITAPLDLRSARTDYDFQQSEIVPSAAHSAIYWDSIQSTFSNVAVEGLVYPTRADWLASGKNLIEWGFEEPGFYSNGSQSNFRNVIARGGYHTFALNSISDVNASFIWGSRFEHCYFQDAVEYCYYFNSPYETSTTMEYATCHARCTNRDAITIGAFDYYCIAHHIADATNEPETGVDWELYWYKEATFTARGAWETGKQYITNAKGFNFYNVNSLSMLGCSMDGGNNLLAGTVINYVGQAINIDRFHLESFNHNRANTLKPINVIGDLTFGHLDLFTHRFRMPNVTDKAYFIGCDVASQSRFTVLNCLNKAPVPDVTTGLVQGLPIWVDGTNTLSVDLGTGVPINAVENLPATATAQRGITKQIVKPLTGPTSTVVYAPDRRENGVKFVTGDSLSPVFLTIELDDYKFYESTDWNQNSQYDSYSFEFFVRAADGTGTLDFVALNTALLIGETSYVEGDTVRATKISASGWSLEKIAGAASSAEWVEFVPVGSYTSGTFTLPQSKTLADIAEIKLTAGANIYYKTGYINLVDAGYSTGQFVVQENPVSNGTNSARLTFSGPTSVSAAIGTSGSASPRLLSAYVKFK